MASPRPANAQPIRAGRGTALVGLTDVTDLDLSGNTAPADGIQYHEL
jgi:hypothetical protein